MGETPTLRLAFPHSRSRPVRFFAKIKEENTYPLQYMLFTFLVCKFVCKLFVRFRLLDCMLQPIYIHACIPVRSCQPLGGESSLHNDFLIHPCVHLQMQATYRPPIPHDFKHEDLPLIITTKNIREI